MQIFIDYNIATVTARGPTKTFQKQFFFCSRFIFYVVVGVFTFVCFEYSRTSREIMLSRGKGR